MPNSPEQRVLTMLRSLKNQTHQLTAAIVTGLFGNQDRLVKLPIVVGPASHLKLTFHFDLTRKIELTYLMGAYEADQVRRLVEICQPGWTVWDCGTYLGFYTALLGKLVGPTGRVLAFEPDPRNLARTKSNADLNHLANVEVHQAAIAGSAQEIEFILSNNTNSHIPGNYVGATYASYAPQEDVTQRVTVPCLSLDRAYAQFEGTHLAPQLIKLDIEGAEIEALQHADHLFRHIRPLLVLELHNPACDAAAWEFAQVYRYRLEELGSGRPLTQAHEVHGTLLCTPLPKA